MKPSFKTTLEEDFSSSLENCDIQAMRNIFHKLSESEQRSLLKNKEVQMGFDLMTKSYLDGAQPASVFHTCLEFYNMCVTSKSSNIIQQYLREDPNIIPNKIKSFLIIFGKRDHNNQHIAGLENYVDPATRSIVNNTNNIQTANDTYNLYHSLKNHFNACGVSEERAAKYSYDISVDALSLREQLPQLLQNPRLTFFSKYGEIADSFSSDSTLLGILSSFGSPQRSVSNSQGKAAASHQKQESKKV